VSYFVCYGVGVGFLGILCLLGGLTPAGMDCGRRLGNSSAKARCHVENKSPSIFSTRLALPTIEPFRRCQAHH